MHATPDRLAEPGPDRRTLRRRLIAERIGVPDREDRVRRLEAIVEAWIEGRPETVIGAYWPIRGEPDLLGLLGAWALAAAGRAIGLPVIDPATSQLGFRAWYPGAPTRADQYGIPEPDGTRWVEPELLLVPCVGYGPGGVRLGYGGGYYDRTLAAASARPFTMGIAFSLAFVPDLLPAAHDVPLDGILTDDGLAWERDA
jgi:5-formyltetrahydrofolate cyclo-ligase